MALRSFDPEDLPLDHQPEPSSSVSVMDRPSAGKLFLISAGDWGWEALRDYVVFKIQSRWGFFPRNPLKEAGIFKSFVTRWGPQAGPIARYAFEFADGIWMGDPISITRFTKGSDPYFAAVIVKKLS